MLNRCLDGRIPTLTKKCSSPYPSDAESRWVLNRPGIERPEHELLTDVALGVGCDTRKQPVWTSTPCGESSYVTAPGESNYHFSGEAPKACAAEGGAAHAVCCGD